MMAECRKQKLCVAENNFEKKLKLSVAVLGKTEIFCCRSRKLKLSVAPYKTCSLLESYFKWLWNSFEKDLNSI